MAVGWVSRVNFKPPMMAVALGRSHYTNAGIEKNKAFSVNVPGMDLLEKVDYCGIVSGEKADKSKVFDVFYGELSRRPDDPGVSALPSSAGSSILWICRQTASSSVRSWGHTLRSVI